MFEIQVLYDDGFFELVLSATLRVIYLRRSPRSFRDQAEWTGAYARATREIARFAQPGWRLFYDLRLARGRNDREFEEATAEYRRRLLTLLDPCAVIVRSAAGQMQVGRHIREVGSAARVFFDLRTAVSKLGLPMAVADALDAQEPEIRLVVNR